jgi:hypothetical protein
VSAYTGQNGASDRSDRSGQELGEFSISTFRDLALVCVDQKSVNKTAAIDMTLPRSIDTSTLSGNEDEKVPPLLPTH